MTSLPQADDRLNGQELRELEALEEKLSRGASVKWDQPKRILGYLARPIEEVEVRDYNDSAKTVVKKVATLRTSSGLQAIWEGPAALDKLFEVEGSGMPVVVAYLGEKTGQESGRAYKAFDVVIGEAPAAEASTADDNIPF